MNEIWRSVPGYEGLYDVSNLGNIKSLNYKRTKQEKILKPYLDSKGYFQVDLRKNNIRKSINVHKVVAMAFLNHIPCGYLQVIDHRNDIKTDNRADNLQAVTSRFNSYKTQGTYSSKYKGVYWKKDAKKWCARIRFNNKTCYLGYFSNEEEAHQAYQNKLQEIEKK